MDIKELHSFKLSDAVKFHDRLNPKLFKNEKLDPEVRKQLLIIAQDFMQELGISGLNVKDITLSGSNAAYTYTKHSDADLHILIDMSKLPEDEVYRELFNSKKNLYNNSHDITVHGIPVELYVQDTNEPVKSLGEYSVLNDKWINIPKKRRATLDITNTRLKFQKLIEIIEIAIKSQDVVKIDTLLGLIRRYRQAGLDKGGEFSPENLAFKALRSQGMIDKLRDVKNKLHSKDLSIENVNESRPELKFLRPGELRGSYTDAQLKAMGFKQAQNGSWYILKSKWEQLVKNRSISEEEKLAERLSKEFEDYDPNGPPPGPEFKPTMPAGTVKVDVSDVYDWYKLGQHISNLKGLGKHDFGKGPPSTILSFGDEDTEHQYISDLEKTGLATTDIDPIDPNRPKGMKKQKVDPTYNVGPIKENEELFEVNFNDPKIINDALNADINCGFEAETVWYQSPVMRDPWEDITDWDELNNVIDSRQERKAFALYDQWMYEHPSFDKYLDRIRNKEINKYIDDDETKIEFFDELFPDRTKLSDEDKIDEIDNSRQLTKDYKEWIADTYVYEELDIQEEAISIFKKKFSMDDFINDVYEGSYSDFGENELGFYFDSDLLSRDQNESMSLVAADLSPWINSSSRFKDYRSGLYHSTGNNPTQWRIETDSSVEPNDPDQQVGAEIISPVYDTPNEMLSEMNSLFKYFDQNNVTTNDSTGLHVTMSYPQATESPNQLKMAVLLGDPYLLKVFDRLENTYTQSQYKRLKDAASFIVDNPNNLREVERLLMPAVELAKHFSSIHFKSNGHVEFRIAGNEDYEKRMPEIRKTVARYAIIMMAGYDSTFLMKDYYTALGRLVRSTFTSGPGDVLQNNFINVYNKLQRSVINKIETDEYPIFMNLKTATPLDKAKAKGVFVDLIDKLSSQEPNRLPAVSDTDSRIIRTTARDLGYTSIDQIIDDMIIPDYRKEDKYDNLDKIFKTKVKREPVTTSTEGFFEAKKTDYFTGSEYSDGKYNWKVEDVLALAKSDPKYFHKDFPLSKLKHDLEWWQGNKERMMNADTSYPLLVIKNDDGHLSVADGLNRMKKAISVEKKKTLDVYIVPKEDTMHLAFENGDSGKSRVAESLDKPYPMKWSRSEFGSRGEIGDWEVLAKLPDGTNLEILFSRMSNTNDSPVELIFLRGDTMELSGKGDAQRVFATVLAAIQQFLKKAQPDTLIFSASKQVEPGQSTRSRSKLYDRLVQRYANAWGYESYQEDYSDHVKYRLTKKENVTEAKKSITLGPQLYVPRKKGLQESLKPNAELWTSTAKVGSNGYTSEWVEWCKQEMPQWVTDEGTLYDVAPGARILNISTDKDVMRIAKKYGIEVKDSMELFMKMRWEMLAKDYDAIHHTVPSNRWDNLFMSAWDVESTAWFNTKFLVNPRKVKVDSGVLGESASGYIPSNAEKDDPRYKTALTVDIKPDTMQKNAKKLGWKISRAGIPPLLRK